MTEANGEKPDTVVLGASAGGSRPPLAVKANSLGQGPRFRDRVKMPRSCALGARNVAQILDNLDQTLGGDRLGDVQIEAGVDRA
jgi:hypothetical protein